ncbi:MAG: serine hydrolase domain-containing protein [Bacteroidia bacterium]
MRRLLFTMITLVFCSSCTVVRSLRWWQPDLADSSKFNYADIGSSALPFKFTHTVAEKKYLNLKRNLDSMLSQSNTNAFLVIKNDSIIYEYFADHIDAQTLHPSFSVAKSYIGTLMGMAIDKGIVASANELVIKYLPELEKNDDRFQRLTIQNVLDMRSGVDFDEDKETPFAGIAKLYYGSSLNKQVLNLKMKNEPGEVFEYQSINTQMLAMILERASGQKITTLLTNFLWKPLGAESGAIWSLDDQKTAKAFCCLNATANDFAKLGRLYLKKGNWEGSQLLSKKWVNETTNPDSLSKMGYKNQWWACNNVSYFKDSISADQKLKRLKLNLPIKRATNGRYYFRQISNDFRAEGILGQIVYVNPTNNVIIVRLGSYPNKNLYFNGFIPEIGRGL